MYNYLNELNDIQQHAVKYNDGPSLIVAGAGSGKTRVLTYKIVHLINTGFLPSNILSLTFTNKAAREMKERMKTLVDEASIKHLWMGTFHSIFARILRVEASLLGFPQSFTIYDSDDTKKLINELIKELKLDTDMYPVGDVYSRISWAKNNLILPDIYANNDEIQKLDFFNKKSEIKKVYSLYFQRCKKAAAMDFDDLLLYTNILLRDFPQVLEKYQNLFQFILVDEYQDTNYAQYVILKKLSALNKKICVVGDDSQSIYAFRGAKIENILNYQRDFQNVAVFKLEQNYRSTKHIVEAANSLIEKNKNRIPKKIFTNNVSGDKIRLLEFGIDRAESQFVAKAILKLKEENNFENTDFAVLYRTNTQSRLFEDAMRKYTIPYKLFGAISFYQRAEIKNIVSYLRILINKSDEQALKRIINFPKRGIGDTTVDKIIQFSNEKNITLWEVLCKIELLTRDLSSRIVTLIQKFVKLINYLSEEAQNLDAVSLVNLVLEKTGITLTMLEDRSPEGVAKYENLQEFVNAVHEYTNNNQENKVISIENFLEEIALATDQDSKETDTNKVSLMTIHASKGLEFKCVFIVGVEEGLFPSYRSITSNKDIEEERRLFYVAITRSERYLFISFCQKRMKWGVLQNASASRFIPEIESIYIEFEKLLENSSNNFDIKKENSNFVNSKIKIDIPKEKFSEKPINLKPIDNKEVSLQNSIEYSESNSYEIGMIVEHEKFGSGIIKDISGDFPNTKVLVNFEKNGQKNLLTKFAKLKIIK